MHERRVIRIDQNLILLGEFMIQNFNCCDASSVIKRYRRYAYSLFLETALYASIARVLANECSTTGFG